MQRIQKRKIIHKRGTKITYWFSSTGILLMVGIMFFVLPKAEIEIFSNSVPITSNFELVLDLDKQEVDVEKEIIPVKKNSLEKRVKASLSQEAIKMELFNDFIDSKEADQKLTYDLIEINSVNEKDGLKKITADAYMFNRNDFEEVINKRMDILLPAGAEFVHSNHKVSYKYKQFPPVYNQIILNVSIENKTIPKIDELVVKEQLINKTDEDFLAYISEKYKDISCSVSYWPINNEQLKKLLTAPRIYININTY